MNPDVVFPLTFVFVLLSLAGMFFYFIKSEHEAMKEDEQE